MFIGSIFEEALCRDEKNSNNFSKFRVILITVLFLNKVYKILNKQLLSGKLI